MNKNSSPSPVGEIAEVHKNVGWEQVVHIRCTGGLTDDQITLVYWSEEEKWIEWTGVSTYAWWFWAWLLYGFENLIGTGATGYYDFVLQLPIQMRYTSKMHMDCSNLQKIIPMLILPWYLPGPNSI